MGNMFLGFPVPRAKIADMIATDAPPTLHKENHEAGGKDELDCTGLVGAGGVTLPFEDYFYNTRFDSIDGIRQSASGGGSLTLDDRYITIECDGVNNAFANIEKRPSYPAVPLTWDKNREFKAQAWFKAATVANTIMVIGTGYLYNGTGFGFIVEDGIFKAVSQVGAAREDHTIEDWSAAPFDEVRRLRAHKTGANEIKFYVDDVLVYTATTTIPSGATYDEKVMYIFTWNTGASGQTWIRLSDWSLWQKA